MTNWFSTNCRAPHKDYNLQIKDYEEMFLPSETSSKINDNGENNVNMELHDSVG